MNDLVSELLASTRLLSVVRASHIGDPGGLGAAVVAAGVPLLEFTLTTNGALAAVREAAGSGAVVGVGTVLTTADAEAALEAGARYIVSPTVIDEVIETVSSVGVPVFAGAFTPTEVRRAADLGATAVKIFPAAIGGPRHLRELKTVFPDVPLFPSGGVDAGNAADFLAAGALAVSVGTGVMASELVEAGDNETIAARLEAMVEAIMTKAAG